MKRIFLIAGGVFALLVVAAMVVPFLVPKDVYKAQIEKAASSALNRDVVLTGDVGISVFPRISASIGGVTVANPEGFASPSMIKAGELRGSVKWLPLLQKRVEVQEISFVDADVQLQKLADGRVNWEFGTGEDTQAEDGGPSGSVDAGVEQARLKNASLTYRDDATGTVYELKDLDLEASLQSLDKPLKAKANGLFQDQTFDVALTLDSLDAMSASKPASLKLTLESDMGKARFDGTVTLGDAGTMDGTFDASSDALDAAVRFAKLDLPYDLSKLGKVSAEGAVSGPLAALQVRLDKVTQSSGLMKTDFAGTVTLGEAPVVDGTLSLSAPSLADVATFAAIDMPYNLSPLGAATVKAALKGPLDKPVIRFDSAGVKSSLIDASYTGALTLGDAPALDGTMKALLPNTGELVKQLGIDIPAEDALERVQVSGALKGAVDQLRLTGLDFTHSGALMDAAFKGNVALGGDGQINGTIDASSSELRALLKAADVEMEPGDTLQTFSAKGGISGTFKTIAFTALNLTLDNIKATGNAGLDLSGARPRLTGKLDMGALDLSPFLGASDQTKKPAQPMTGWSKEPLDLAGLKSVDADLSITTSSLVLGNVTLTKASVVTALDDGLLVADLPAFAAFGGNWSGKMSVDSRQATPAVSFAMSGDSIAMSSLLGTLAGFDKLTGAGGFTVNASASGQSIDEIMRGLNGQLSTKLADGTLKGLNVTQLVRSAQSLQTAFTTGSLQNLDFGSVLSPAAETEFTSFDAVLKIEDGVAKVDLMKLLNPVLGIDGTGVINLGGQSLDLRLATSIDKKGTGAGSVVQLNGIPVPVRLSGSWSKLKVSPDFSGVQAALQAELGARVVDGLTGKLGGNGSGDLGGTLGNAIGGALGLPAKPATTPSGTAPETTPDAAAETAAPTPQPTLEDVAKEQALKALGDAFGSKEKKPADPAPATDPEAPTETPASDQP